MLNAPNYQNIQSLEETGFGYALSLIGGKYKMVILFWLHRNPPNMRFNELQRKIGKISVKTLSQSLKELENDGLVIRTEYPQIPPKVEYSLSDKGLSLIPILDALCEWGERCR
ncbi:winged helix-turn-helix transcriptional regulator [Wielerella bovis]|uniref:winged helix-turn-helix transcriptional regulator n=1 Tax=Wielerella bovis TaxID=2917790 RepID=UPI0020194D01|nr:helix-turn-helix domain-containing protein [Wielerella bovis]ULJ59533.1 helix-turn-helix transcriptional regulator [Wielerella bovis]ULJ61763.1 helix-turn-helix transcriptional regulator [Wielerella bovis]ULJ63890.1 helix-turn-helix transcriptional regulator [Wielerella bovis]ULJ68128.1 helix-turn-helix transcriptional regulator [Wielerella bovis]ULJ68525.1 helix-turn-helix transcriptional regulator [Wielerella bovis]